MLYNQACYANSSSNSCGHNNCSSKNFSLNTSNDILLERQRGAELAQQQAERQQQQLRQQPEPLRLSSSQERIVQDAPAPQAQPPRRIDSAEITETRTITATPTTARNTDERPAGHATLPSAVVEEKQKRSREDESFDDSMKKKVKSKDKSSSSSPHAQPTTPIHYICHF